MDYLTIVNKSNLIKDSYYNDLELVSTKDILGETIEIEKTTYEAYLKLKECLEKQGIIIALDSAFRSIEKQQKIIDEYMEKYGPEYVAKYVAPARASEHHTGLAIDVVIVRERKEDKEEEAKEKMAIYSEIHKYLSDFGFILRYPRGKEEITGYNCELWHYRYVGKEPAKIIEKCNLTLEEYVNLRKTTSIDKIKTPQDILDFMNGHIRYGWLDINGEEHIGNMKDFRRIYRTSTLEEVLSHGLGTCIEQVMLMSYLLNKINVPNKMFCTRVYEGRDFNNLEAEEHMHCFILYYMDGKVYQLEHPNWEKVGIHEYESEDVAIREINDYYVKMAEGKSRPVTEFYEVKPGLSFKEFNEYINSLDGEISYANITIG